MDRGDAAHAVDRGAVAVRGRCARRALLSHHARADARPGPDHPWADFRARGHRGLAQDTQDGSCDGREAARLDCLCKRQGLGEVPPLSHVSSSVAG